MAITASFAADFSDFSSEVKKAEGDLLHFEGQTTQTADAIGGMGAQATTTAGPVNNLQQSFRQFDGALAAAGIHIGPAIKGIEDIAGAAGKTATELGALATAGLVVGTAVAAWKLGRVVADFLGLDNAIATNVASWMGWGDTVKETAGSVTDAIVLAQSRTTATVTSLSQAMAVNQKWVEEHTKAAKEAAERYDVWAKATETVKVATQDWQTVLGTIRGSIQNLAKEALAAGVSQQTVAAAYHLTASEIAAIVSAMAAEKEALKESAAEHARITAVIKVHSDAVLQLRDELQGKAIIEQAQVWVEAIHRIGGSLDTLTGEQLEHLRVAMAQAIDVMARTGQLTDHLSSEFAALGLAAQAAQAAHVPLVATVDHFAQSEYDAAVATDKATQALQQQKDEAKALADQMKQTVQSFSYAGGNVPTAASLTEAAKRPGSFLGFGTGQMIQSMPTSVANLPWGPQAPAPVRVEPGAFVINYPIMNDPNAMDQLGRLVGDAVMSRVTRSGAQV